MTIQDHNEAFQEIIDGLNDAQRKAVETIEGPVLVVAGPGTGKTHILAARIGKILTETDAQPHNILCLTFTESGVRSMRNRLIKFIGPEAHRVHIHTFHSFSNRVIRENLEWFGRKELEPISELERIELLQQLIDELPIDHALKQGRGADIYYYIPHLKDLFSKMKSENWSPQFLTSKIDVYIKSLPEREVYHYKVKSGTNVKGDLKQHKIDEEIRKVKLLRAAANLFPAFSEKMNAWRRYDFQDMILWTLEAFKKNPMVLRNYQEQYLYFLVDEFQDTNGAQNEILSQLIEYWENPNVFVVGDDDQSIFEFQGARLKNLTDYYEKYKAHLELIILGDNYRSSQQILDASHTLISKNKIRITNRLEDIGVEKLLTAKNREFANLAVRPNVVEYQFQFHEVADIVNQIEQMKTDGFPLEEIAIIYSKHKQSKDIIELFNKKGIPYSTRKKVNLLDLPFVRQIRTILEYLLAESISPFSGEHHLFKMLHFPFWKNDLNDIARLSLFFAKARKDKKDYYWKEAILDADILKAAGVKSPDSILNAGQIIQKLQSQSYELSMPHLVESLFNKSGLLAWALQQPDKAQWTQILHTFLDFVKAEAARNPKLDLNRLLEIFKSMDDNRIDLELQKIAQTEAGVNLMTAHGSKGLEFQRVFILDCLGDFWEPAKRGAQYQFSLPDTITYSTSEDEEEARRRLFYVAMTRAKEKLYLSYSRQNNKGKDVQRTIFLEEILQGTKLEVTQKSLTEKDILEAQSILLSDSEITKIESPNPAVIQEVLEDFKMSVSALNGYIYCPIGFYYEHIMKVPSVQRESASYGTAVHEALENLFRKMLASKTKTFPKLKDFIADFEKELYYFRGFFTEHSYKERLRSGKFHLKNFYRTHIKNWHRTVKLEYRISNVEVDGVPLTGVIDRVEYHEGNRVHVVDYKTNKPKKESLKKATDRKPEGGNYWRQLVFYKLLFENFKNTDYKADSAEIAYLEPDQNGDYLNPTVKFTPDQVNRVRTLIKETYKKIMNQEFYEGCSKKECVWCSFVDQNQMPDTFSNQEIEALDDL